MCIDPDQAEWFTRLANMGRCGGDRPGTETVIAAKDDRHGAVTERREAGLIQLLADARDVFHIFLARIAGALLFGNRRRHIALVAHRDAELRQMLGQAGNAEGRRPHVGAAAIPAEIQRDAADVDRARVLFLHGSWSSWGSWGSWSS